MEDQQKAAYASLANFSKSGEKNKMETTNKNKFSLGNYLWGIGSYEPYEERAKFLKEFETRLPLVLIILLLAKPTTTEL